MRLRSLAATQCATCPFYRIRTYADVVAAVRVLVVHAAPGVEAAAAYVVLTVVVVVSVVVAVVLPFSKL